jgi:hypothetical protein
MIISLLHATSLARLSFIQFNAVIVLYENTKYGTRDVARERGDKINILGEKMGFSALKQFLNYFSQNKRIRNKLL